MSGSKILLFLCISFIVGIFFESLTNIPQFVLWIFLFIGFSLIFASSFLLFSSSEKHWNSFLFAGFFMMLFILGILRMQISEFNIVNNRLSRLNDTEEKITLTGTVIKEPDLKESSQRIKIKTDDFGSIVLATVGRYPEYAYLDRVQISGNLKTPIETEDFSYKNYLLKDHIHSVVYFPEIIIQKPGSLNLFEKMYALVLWSKNKMRQSIRHIFLMPESSIVEGVILGDKSAISQETKDDFRNTGLSHIIAVSGMHMAILGTIVMAFLLAVGISRNFAFYGASVFILVFTVLVGFPASAVRAGIMGVICLLAEKLGRQSASSRIIFLAAALMLLINPLLLIYDVGFQLSFLAILGIIYFEPIIRFFIKDATSRLFNIRIKEKYNNALAFFTVSFSAQAFTLPIIIFNFGSVSYVSILTNILVLPAIYGVMLFGFLSAISGTFFWVFGWLLSLPSYFLLKYILWVIDIFSKPWAVKTFENVSWLWPAVLYVFLLFFVIYFGKKMKDRFLDF